MKARLLIFLTVFLLLVAGGFSLYAWNSRPRLVMVAPQAGAEYVGATESIRLEFSRPMDQSSVESRLSITPAADGQIRWEKNSLVFTPHQAWPNGQMVQVQLERGARASQRLAFLLNAMSWSFTIGQVNLAYLWPSSGPANIYSLDPLTGSIHPYTHGMTVLDFSANPAGSIFYFSASNSQAGADLYQLDRLKADSFPEGVYLPEKLMDCGMAQCRNPVVSPDGRVLAYEYLPPQQGISRNPVQVWSLRLSDLSATPIGQANHETLQPSWSSNGLLAYYDRTSSAYEVYNPATQLRIQLTNQTGQPGAWDPTGATYLAPEISYQQTSSTYETGSSHLYSYLIQENSHEDLSGDNAVEDVEAVWSPTGALIAFTRKFLDAAHWTQGRQIWIMNSDGSNPFPITNEADFNHYDLAWRQDGSMLAYVRFNQASLADPPELWMIHADGSQPVLLKVGGYSPLWIP